VTTAATRQGTIPELNYHLLRNALEGFGKSPGRLDPEEYRQVHRRASRSFELESLVLAAPEAKGLVIPEQLLDRSVGEIATRYESEEAFIVDLEANGLDREGLRRALYRELLFDAVMQRVSARSAEVTDLDIRLFYQMHRERFQPPEQRTASHILITVNPDFPENTRSAALVRMEQIAAKLAGRANRFHTFAKRQSECPTAMEGGRLGEVRRGQLYPELDAVLFKMEEQQVSPIVESEMGFHILLCERIKSGQPVSLAKARPRIREILRQRRQRNCQKAWLSALQRS